MRVDDVTVGSEHFDAITRLYRSNKKTLGFMPKGAFEQRAIHGTLIVAVNDEESVAGYLLYDLPRHHITIRHLCVATAFRGQRVPKLLVDELRRRHPERQGIALECRNDYDAHRLWPRLDFEATDEGPGHSRSGLPLTSWWLDFGHPNLFTREVQDEPLLDVAIDTDVFIDLFEDRPNSAQSRGLITDWVGELVQLVITKSVLDDLSHHDDPSVRARRRSEARGFARRDASTQEWLDAEKALLDRLGKTHLNDHDRNDASHVARAAAARIGYFVTRDADLVKKLGPPAWELFQLRVRLPGNFLTELWNQVEAPYAPVILENTRFSIEEPPPDNDEGLLVAFLNARVGERKGELAKKLQECRADPQGSRLRIVQDSSGQVVALFAQSLRGRRLNVPLFRVEDRFGATVSRQIAHTLREEALVSGSTIEIADRSLSMQVPGGLTAEGYFQDNDSWWAMPVDRHATPAELADLFSSFDVPEAFAIENVVSLFRSAELPMVSADELERRFAPMKIANASLPSYLISIQPDWAEQLFDTELSEQKMFGRDDRLGMSREHVYYSAAKLNAVTPPARIVWYVSKDAKRHATGEVRATSRLAEVAHGRPLDLFRRFRRLGVYRRDQVLALGATHSSLTALRFTDTERFLHPIPLGELRTLAAQHGQTLVLQSPQRLPQPMFDLLYTRGRYGSI